MVRVEVFSDGNGKERSGIHIADGISGGHRKEIPPPLP